MFFSSSCSLPHTFCPSLFPSISLYAAAGKMRVMRVSRWDEMQPFSSVQQKARVTGPCVVCRGEARGEALPRNRHQSAHAHTRAEQAVRGHLHACCVCTRVRALSVQEAGVAVALDRTQTAGGASDMIKSWCACAPITGERLSASTLAPTLFSVHKPVSAIACVCVSRPCRSRAARRRHAAPRACAARSR